MDCVFRLNVKVNDDNFKQFNTHYNIDYDQSIKDRMTQDLAHQLVRRKSHAIKRKRHEYMPLTEYSLQLYVLTESELNSLVKDRVEKILKNKEENGQN